MADDRHSGRKGLVESAWPSLQPGRLEGAYCCYAVGMAGSTPNEKSAEAAVAALSAELSMATDYLDRIDQKATFVGIRFNSPWFKHVVQVSAASPDAAASAELTAALHDPNMR